MTLEQRDRFRLLAAAALVVLVGFTILLRQRFAPMAEELVITQVDNQASAAINDAIQDQIESGEIDYERMIITEKDTAGSVTALHANIAGINRLKTEILNRVDERLLDLSVEELGVPLGSVILPELFSGCGRILPSASWPFVRRTQCFTTNLLPLASIRRCIGSRLTSMLR